MSSDKSGNELTYEVAKDMPPLIWPGSCRDGQGARCHVVQQVGDIHWFCCGKLEEVGIAINVAKPGAYREMRVVEGQCPYVAKYEPNI